MPGGRRKRGKPTDRTPPGAPKKIKETEEVCLICNVIIQEGEEPDDALYCEGQCQRWLHRKCVSMTNKVYLALGQSEEPYFCPHCKCNVYQKEINSLKDTIKALSDEVTYLKSREESVHLTATSVEQASVTPHSVNHQQSSNKAAKPDGKPTAGILPGDHKFNIVLFGIKEHPPDTSRPDRIKFDIANCLNVITKLNSEINSQSIIKYVST